MSPVALLEATGATGGSSRGLLVVEPLVAASFKALLGAATWAIRVVNGRMRGEAWASPDG